VHGLDRRFARAAHGDGLACASVAGVEVRRDDAGADQMVSFQGTAVDRQRDALPLAQVNHLAHVVIHDAIALDDLCAELGDLFVVAGAPIQAAGTQEIDIVVAHAGELQLVQQRRHQQVLGQATAGWVKAMQT